MDDRHLFELINSAPHPQPWLLWAALFLAQWLIGLLPVAVAVAWARGDGAARRELVEMLLAVLLATALAEATALLWPRPRPFALHLGTQLLAHVGNAGLPSEHVTVFWALAAGALATRRFGLWGYPLFAAGLAVGWSRVFLGVHFPYDIVAALPVALAGALAARALRPATRPHVERLVKTSAQLTQALRARWLRARGL